MEQPYAVTNASKSLALNGLPPRAVDARMVDLTELEIFAVHGGHLGAIIAAANALTSAIDIEGAIARYQVCCSLGVIDC